MSMPPLSDLVRGATLRGAAPTALSPAVCTRIGRAFGTWTRRRLGGPRTIALARSHDGAQLVVRDGIVRGLVLSGAHVADVGLASAEALERAALALCADAAVLLSSSEGAVHSVTFFLGGKAIAPEALAELCALGDAGELSAGEGSLAIVDARALEAASPSVSEAT